MNNLPLIPTTAFFAVLALLFAMDAWSTSKLLRSKVNGWVQVETNKVVAALIKAFGIDVALIVSKLAVLAFLWFFPLPYAWLQWGAIALYVYAAANNFHQLKKIGAI